MTPRLDRLTPARQRQVPNDSKVTGGPSAVILRVFSGLGRVTVAQRGPAGPSPMAKRPTLDPAATTRSPAPGFTSAQIVMRSNSASGSAVKVTLAPGFSDTSLQPERPNADGWPGASGKLGSSRQPSD